MRTKFWFQTLFTIPFCLILTLVSGQCQIDHQSMLIRLKKELRFDSSLSKKLVTWNPNTTENCCTWEGVTCSITGQVIGLDLSNETITGGIEDSSPLFDLKNLQRLNLAANDFNFTQIPSRFGDFSSLLYLNLSYSMFSGQIPWELSQLTSLEVLDLSMSFFFSLGTTSLKLEKPNLADLVHNFRRLKQLVLDNVNISSQKDDWCHVLSTYLPNLEVLSLSNCQLSGPLDDSLETLQSLSVIRLGGNNIRAPVPNFFANFKNLTVLNLGDCYLNGTFPEKVLELEKLQILDIAFNTNLNGFLPDFPVNGSLQSLVVRRTKFSGQVPESIGNLKSLSRIEFQFSNFVGQLPRSMGGLTHLSYIDMSYNSFTGQIPSFQLCENLTHIDCSHNSFTGIIPPSLFSLQKLQKIMLSENYFDGLIPNISSSSLDTLDLSINKLEGQIPKSFFQLSILRILLLSSNKLTGIIETKDFERLGSLTILDLSFNNLTILTTTMSDSDFPKLMSLKLASCNLLRFPNLRNQSDLSTLDLSYNKIQGEIPNWIWRDSLRYLSLSNNRLQSFQEPYQFPDLYYLDLHSNHITGMIPIPPQTAIIVDYSENLFNMSIPENIGRNLSVASFFSVSHNLLTGVIPETICNASYLKVLDLSNNHLTGKVPRCLIEFTGRLGVLDLGNNSLSGQIDGTFPETCTLNTLDFHGNSFEGRIPRSLVNCKMLDMLNLGNNKMNDSYPCFLGNNTNLRVLVLRSNTFHGSVRCGEVQHIGSKLQILDISHNKFNDTVPANYFSKWDAMMSDESKLDQSSKKHMSFTVFLLNDLSYQNMVQVTVKGVELQLVKILTLFTSIDISSNHFSGEIPSTLGQLKALYLLNVSHNDFTNSIPPSIGDLTELESLDMSSNKLTGNIPFVLTNLTFLSVFNVSYNQLRGKIPTGSQFQTFEKNSYLGNKGLCGFPLNITCTGSGSTVTLPLPNFQESKNGNDWQTLFHAMGAGAGTSIVIVVLYSVYKRNTSDRTRKTNLSR